MKALVLVLGMASTVLPLARQEPVEGAPGLIEMAVGQGVKPYSPDSGNTFLFSFARDGEVRETLLIMAGGSFSTPDLPPDSAPCVSLLAGMPYSLGDGVTLSISVEEGESRTEVLNMTLDAPHVRAHRSWVPLRFDLSDRAEAFRLRFEVGPGERGDYTYDWLGFAPGSDAGCLFSVSSP